MVVSFRPTSHGWLVEKTQRRTAEKRKPKEFNLFKQLDKVGLTQVNYSFFFYFIIFYSR